MFTGIIEELGTVGQMDRRPDSIKLTIQARKVLEGTQLGDSIAVNGVCLTVTSMTDSSFTADVMHETMRRSSLSDIKSGSKVNLERAMACGGRFGGHLVSGHVDACGRVADLVRDGIALVMRVSVPSDVLRYVTRKGSVTLDGVSLTVASVSDSDSSFTVSLIPHTMASTTLHLLKPGSPVNVEVDMLARYVERLLAAGDAAPASAQVDSGSAGGGITEEFLKKYGF